MRKRGNEKSRQNLHTKETRHDDGYFPEFSQTHITNKYDRQKYLNCRTWNFNHFFRLTIKLDDELKILRQIEKTTAPI